MKVETYKVYNPNKKIKINPNESIKQALVQTDLILKILGEIKPEISNKYISALKKRLKESIEDFHIDTDLFELDEIRKVLVVLNDYLDLQELVIQLTCKFLDVPKPFTPQEKIEVLSLNYIKTIDKMSYYRVKAFTDVLNRAAGISLWKKILNQKLIEEREKNKAAKSGQKELSSAEIIEGAIKYWTKLGMADFTVAILDEHMDLMRFDKCLVHEALKDLNDPDIAYLASCFIGDAEEYNTGKTRYLRRTQTLHHGDFCDELRWDPRIHDNPEQPSLDFTRKLSGGVVSKKSLEAKKEKEERR